MDPLIYNSIPSGSNYRIGSPLYKKNRPGKKRPWRFTMDHAIRVERQDLRTFVLETLIHYENFLDPRMYECADYLTSAGHTTDTSHVIHHWNEWKNENPSDNPQVKI